MNAPRLAGPGGEPIASAPANRLPAGIVALGKPLAETIACLALGRIESYVNIDDWAVIFRCSRREIERMRAAGTLPPQDRRLGKRPLWCPATVRAFLDRDGGGRTR